MEADIKLAFDILAFTSVMVLIVLGLGVIASMMGIFNFAHGELVLLGAYTLYLFHERGQVFERAAERGEWPSGVDPSPLMEGLLGAVYLRVFVLHEPVTPRHLRPLLEDLAEAARMWPSRPGATQDRHLRTARTKAR